MRRVRHDTEHVLEDVCVVSLVEGLGGFDFDGDVLQQLEQNIQSRVGDVAHRVLERPDDGVQDQLELGRRDAQEAIEAEQIDGL